MDKIKDTLIMIAVPIGLIIFALFIRLVVILKYIYFLYRYDSFYLLILSKGEKWTTKGENMKINCPNYECIFRNNNTKLCTKDEIDMCSDSWNRHGVCCNSVEYGNKADISFYRPDELE